MARPKPKILEDIRKFTQKNKWDKAIEAYQELLEVEPDDPSPLNSIGDLYTKIGKMSDAISFFRKAIDQYNEIGLFNNAIAICKKIMRADPNHTVIYKKLAELYTGNGLTNDAIRHYVLYADKMHEKNQVDEVLDSFKKIVELSPTNIDIRLRLTELYLKNGRKPEAIEQLTALVSHFDEMGDPEKAGKYRQKIAEIDPSAVPSSSSARTLQSASSHEKEEEEEDIAFNQGMQQPEETEGTLDFAPAGDSPISFSKSSTGSKKLEPAKKPAPEEDSDTLEFNSDSGGIDASGLNFSSNAAGEEESGNFSAGELELSTSLDDTSPDITSSIGSGSDNEPVQDLTSAFQSGSLDEEEPVQDLTASFQAGSYEEEPEEPSQPVEKPLTERSIDELKLLLSDQPNNNDARLVLGNKLLKQSPREALDEFLEACDGFSAMRNYSSAIICLEKAIEIAPDNLSIHKKLLEVAAHEGDMKVMIGAYLGFGDTLARLGEVGKAQFVYQKILGIDRENADAKERLEQIRLAEEATRRKAEEEAAAQEAEAAEAAAAAAADEDDGGGMVDLASLLSEDDGMGKQQNDKIRIERKGLDTSLELDDIISDFKAGVQQHIEDEDYESHYDLGLAYKEMGLTDEAINEFQIATRSSKQRLKAFEMLGLCFQEKNDLDLALKQFQRGISTPGHSEFEYLGLYYNTGIIYEKLGQWEQAKKAYEEVYVVDISFKDIAQRVEVVQKNLG